MCTVKIVLLGSTVFLFVSLRLLLLCMATYHAIDKKKLIRDSTLLLSTIYRSLLLFFVGRVLAVCSIGVWDCFLPSFEVTDQYCEAFLIVRKIIMYKRL